MEHNTYDVAVIGAGVAGIFATALLAKAGRSVVLLERSETLGGRGQTRDKQGFSFNMGAHAIYLQGTANQLSLSLGIDPPGKPPVINAESQLYADGAVYPFPGTPSTIMTSPYWSLRDRLNFFAVMPKIMMEKLDTLGDMRYTDWLQKNVKSDAVRAYLAANGRVGTYMNVADLSAKHALNQFRWVLQKGVRYVDGGWGRWLNSVATHAQQNGALVLTKQRVTDIAAIDGQYAIKTTEKTISAVKVLIATPPDVAAKLLPAGNRVETALPWMKPIRVAALNIAVSHLPHPNRCFATATDRPLYYSLHSAAAKLGPEGQHLLHLMKYLPDEYAGSPDADLAELEAWLDQIQPGWRQYVIESEFLPRIAVMHDSPRVGHQRIGIETDLPNVYLAGDWAHADQIVADGAAQSALKVVDRMLA